MLNDTGKYQTLSSPEFHAVRLRRVPFPRSRLHQASSPTSPTDDTQDDAEQVQAQGMPVVWCPLRYTCRYKA